MAPLTCSHRALSIIPTMIMLWFVPVLLLAAEFGYVDTAPTSSTSSTCTTQHAQLPPISLLESVLLSAPTATSYVSELCAGNFLDFNPQSYHFERAEALAAALPIEFVNDTTGSLHTEPPGICCTTDQFAPVLDQQSSHMIYNDQHDLIPHPCPHINDLLSNVPSTIGRITELEHLWDDNHALDGHSDPKISVSTFNDHGNPLHEIHAERTLPLPSEAPEIKNSSDDMQSVEIDDPAVSSSSSANIIVQSQHETCSDTRCPVCGALRHSNGKFVLPQDILPKSLSFDATLQFIRQAVDRYQHHCPTDLSRLTNRVLRSFMSIIKCYDVHCRGIAAVFQSRHPHWGARTFHLWNCSGKDACDYMLLSDKRRLTNERRRQKYPRKLTLPQVDLIDQRSSSNLSTETHPTARDSNTCGVCGLSRNRSGRFVIPPVRFTQFRNLETTLKLIRGMYGRYNHHGHADLSRTSYDLLISMRHILICYDYHCEGSLEEFQNRHPKLVIGSFRVQGCSGRRASCNYQERAKIRKRHNDAMVQRHNLNRRTKLATSIRSVCQGDQNI